MNKLIFWIKAFRFRTLTLSISSLLIGNFLAKFFLKFNFDVALYSILTAVSLQILSNLSNDYGDGIKNTDNENRIGPQRAIQSGVISIREMKIMIGVFILISLILGLNLLYNIFFSFNNFYFILYFILGIISILSAIYYTVSKKAYGYFAFGDLFVFLFFGLLGVYGIFFLQTQMFLISPFLLSISVGLLCVGVLHLNNYRDIKNDIDSGKITIAVKLGNLWSKVYFIVLLIFAFILIFIFLYLHPSNAWISLISLPLFIINAYKVLTIKEKTKIDSQLKLLSISIFVFSILFCIGIII